MSITRRSRKYGSGTAMPAKYRPVRRFSSLEISAEAVINLDADLSLDRLDDREVAGTLLASGHRRDQK